ncbi:MAG: hypothetical protein RL111_1124 [Pseudomonadota bacterium]
MTVVGVAHGRQLTHHENSDCCKSALIMNQDELLLPILGMFIPRLGMFKILGQAHAHYGASPWVQ